VAYHKVVGKQGDGKSKKGAALGTIGVVLIGIAMVIAGRYKSAQVELAKNYRLAYSVPTGWREIPHSPEALFLYVNPKTHLLMRGAMNDVQDAENPTPGLDRDATAKWMIQITSENLKNWKGEMLDTVDGHEISFRLVKRTGPGKCVVTAVAVRGNTTIMVTMSGDQHELKDVDPALPAFRQYLTTLAFTPFVYQG
jgi:hypothetical protein